MVAQDSPYNARFSVEGYPCLKILSSDGFVVGEPQGRDVKDFVQACADGKKADADFKADLKKADMSKPEVRSDFVIRFLKRGDADSAQKLYDGFDAKDASSSRFDALMAVAHFLAASGKVDDVGKMLDAAEKQFKSDDQVKQMKDLRAELLVHQIEAAIQKKDKDTAFKLFDQLCDKYPDYQDMAKHKDEIKQKIQEMIDQQK